MEPPLLYIGKISKPGGNMTHAIWRRKRSSAPARFSYNFLHDCTTVLEPGTGYVTPSQEKVYFYHIFSDFINFPSFREGSSDVYTNSNHLRSLIVLYTRAFVLLFNFARRTKPIIPREQTKQPVGRLKALELVFLLACLVQFASDIKYIFRPEWSVVRKCNYVIRAMKRNLFIMITLDRTRAHQRCDESGLMIWYIRAYQFKLLHFVFGSLGHFCGGICSFHGTEVVIAWEIKA